MFIPMLGVPERESNSHHRRQEESGDSPANRKQSFSLSYLSSLQTDSSRERGQTKVPIHHRNYIQEREKKKRMDIWTKNARGLESPRDTKQTGRTLSKSQTEKEGGKERSQTNRSHMNMTKTPHRIRAFILSKTSYFSMRSQVHCTHTRKHTHVGETLSAFFSRSEWNGMGLKVWRDGKGCTFFLSFLLSIERTGHIINKKDIYKNTNVTLATQCSWKAITQTLLCYTSKSAHSFFFYVCLPICTGVEITAYARVTNLPCCYSRSGAAAAGCPLQS